MKNTSVVMSGYTPVTQNDMEKLIKSDALGVGPAKNLFERFISYVQIAQEWAVKAMDLEVTNESQTHLMKMARVGRLALREKRLALEKTRKELKQRSVEEGRAIDAVARLIRGAIEPVEEFLKKQEKFVELKRAEEERIAREQAEKARLEEEERQRVAREAEAERIRKENERLERETKEAREKAATEARAREEAERQAAAEKQRREAAEKTIEDHADAHPDLKAYRPPPTPPATPPMPQSNVPIAPNMPVPASDGGNKVIQASVCCPICGSQYITTVVIS